MIEFQVVIGDVQSARYLHTFRGTVSTVCTVPQFVFIWPSLIESSPKAFLINRIVSEGECPSLNSNLMQIRSSAGSVIVNVTVTQYSSSLNGVSLPTD